jgi:phosphatidylserine/phosphatidylglycerophosphate/cardiolipin synthase-like enzyme
LPSRLGSDAAMASVYSFVLSARTSVDMTMYELRDARMVADLVADRRRGVTVRVILDSNREHSRNLEAFEALQSGGVRVVWAGADYEATHQKTITVDGSRSLILTANLTSAYYTTTRDFGVFDSRPADVASVEAVFNADFAHRAVTPPSGADLVWSPGSQTEMLAVIDGARHTLSIENEEMDDAAITNAIAAAAARGVKVDVVMTADSSYDTSLAEIVRAGGHVHLYSDDSWDLYIHAKTTIADAGRKTEDVYVGSINFSSASMNRNRELGIVTTSPDVVEAVNAVVSADFSDCSAATDCRSYA